MLENRLLLSGDFLVTVDALATNDATPALTGDVDNALATVQVTVDGDAYAANNNGDGTWTLPDNTVGLLLDGTYDVSVTATDGILVGSDDSTDELTIDTAEPVVTVDSLTTTDATPALTGTVDDPTATISVTVNGVAYPGVNNGDSTWTLADNTVATLAPTDYDVTVTATDTLGNVGSDATTDELSVRTGVTLGGQDNPSRIVFVDADGSTVVVRASRNGSVVLNLTSTDTITNTGTAARPVYTSADGISLDTVEVAGDTGLLAIAAHGGTVPGTNIGAITGDATLTVLRAGTTNLVGGVNMTGVIGHLLVKNLSGDVTMGGTYDSGVSIRVLQDINQSDITLSTSDVRSFVTGTMIDSSLIVLGGVTAGDVGVRLNRGQIRLIRISGYHGVAGDYMINSNIAAGLIGRAYIRQVQLDNGGGEFGLTADHIDLLKLRQNGHRYRYGGSWLADPMDFTVELPEV